MEDYEYPEAVAPAPPGGTEEFEHHPAFIGSGQSSGLEIWRIEVGSATVRILIYKINTFKKRSMTVTLEYDMI